MFDERRINKKKSVKFKKYGAKIKNWTEYNKWIYSEIHKKVKGSINYGTILQGCKIIITDIISHLLTEKELYIENLGTFIYDEVEFRFSKRRQRIIRYTPDVRINNLIKLRKKYKGKRVKYYGIKRKNLRVQRKIYQEA